ncbi:efflux RND transporter periplasmic adaptor subunit [Brachybacterium squillarum]|uniref:efflux RND transporter periplasmic adaptor subunit n=1 Tax=Brachybacterium squillarum TaxID=661979 RepID=UPI0002629725|nr:efflux RND transporter periplasmic adaptor subunit [Brachybacterium squillarum]
MNIIRRYVFPILWLAIFAVIALALGRMAFFSNSDAAAEEGDDGAVPVAEVEEYTTVAVTPGDITSVLELDGTVQADEGESILANHEGEINKIWVSEGDRIEEGARVLQVRVEQEPEAAAAEVDENGEPVASEEDEEPEYRYYTLEAKDSGTVEDLSVMEGQTLSVGDEVGSLSPGTYAIVADLTPEQQLSLLDVESEATAVLPTAEDPITCEDTTIDEQAGDTGGSSSSAATGEVDPETGEAVGGGGTGSSSAQLRCPIPADVDIVPGLTVDVSIDLGSKTDVLTLPTTAVEGELNDGGVYVLDEETGEPVRQDVTLGLRGDGLVEITGGLDEGAQVLEYVPGVDSEEEEQYGEEVW